MADKMTGAARAFIGQGLGMGWGDEGEAWIRSKLGNEPYDQSLQRIRQEYGAYARENPATAMAAEFAGGMTPALGMMLLPGGQAAGAAQAARTTGGALARLAGLGAATGAVSGAGLATEGERGQGAVVGGTLGAGLGVAVPVALRGTKGAASWLRDRLAPSDASIAQRAGEKMTRAMQEADLTPAQIKAQMAKDRAMNVPSTVANTNAALADLAEAVAQRTGRGTRQVEKTLIEQKAGARERTFAQVRAGLSPGDYYADEARLVKELRDKAKTVYDNAYAFGDVDDPRIVEALKNPQFQAFFNKARSIADTEAMAAKLRGEDPSRYALPEIYKPTGKFTDSGSEILELTKLPDVRTLDYIKRGIDATIDSGFKGQGMSTAEASALRDLRKVFVGAIDENVPAYRDARKAYAGDMEVIDAMRSGMNDFGKLDPEQVVKLVSGMGQAEKEAFRTGVTRNIYGEIMGSAQNRNAANNLINSPETAAKLQPLFDDPAHFRLFKAALERESQLFQQASKILGGSQTAKRQAMAESLDEGPGVGQAVVQGALGNFGGALSGLVNRFANSATITPQVADKLAGMLMSKSPAEVAAVVKFLDEYAAGQIPKVVLDTALERGAVMGAATSVFNPPPVEDTGSIGLEETAQQQPMETSGDLEREYLKTQGQAGGMPAGGMPAGGMPAGGMPAGGMPAGQIPDNQELPTSLE